MDVCVKFKELIVNNAPSVKEACEVVEKRNPDVKIDEAYKLEVNGKPLSDTMDGKPIGGGDGAHSSHCLKSWVS